MVKLYKVMQKQFHSIIHFAFQENCNCNFIFKEKNKVKDNFNFFSVQNFPDFLVNIHYIFYYLHFLRHY